MDGMLSSAVDTASSVRLNTSNRTKVDNVASLLPLELWAFVHQLHPQWKQKGELTFYEELGHRNQTKDIGCKHCLDLTLLEIADMIHT